MAQAIWTGSVTFGLVNVPVRMYSGLTTSRPSFHQIDRETGERVRYQRLSAESGREVSSDDIVKGYEVGRDAYVIVEPEDLDELAPERSRALEIECFVDVTEIDPAAWHRFYYLGPDETRGPGPGYALLVRTLEESGRAGIARFVWRDREHLTALRAHAGVLALDTLRFAHEIREPRTVFDELPETGDVRKRDLDLALKLVEEMAEPWRHDAWKDEFTEEVRDLLEQKAQGRKTTVGRPRKKASGKVIDFTEALERSLAERSGGGGRRREDLGALSKDELYEQAAKADVPGRSRMTKVELIDALRKRRKKKQQAS